MLYHEREEITRAQAHQHQDYLGRDHDKAYLAPEHKKHVRKVTIMAIETARTPHPAIRLKILVSKGISSDRMYLFTQ
jgi:hypothetical protein